MYSYVYIHLIHAFNIFNILNIYLIYIKFGLSFENIYIQKNTYRTEKKFNVLFQAIVYSMK